MMSTQMGDQLSTLFQIFSVKTTNKVNNFFQAFQNKQPNIGIL